MFYVCAFGGGACGTSGGTGGTAGGRRKSGTYSAWGYMQDAQGVITGYGASVPAPTY
jgi:hypothetical protein